MRGTFIQTPLGPAPIESLRVGEMVLTQQNGLQEIRWAGGRRLDAGELAANPKLRPIRIVAGALGNGLPTRDMLVSRQHRMLVQSRIAERMFGVTEVFIPAIKLIALPGIFIDEEVQEAEYYHLLFDRHEVIFAEGAPTESLYTGPEALKALGPEARTEILTLFPELATLDYKPEPACFIPQGRQQVKLVSRHLKNARALLEA